MKMSKLNLALIQQWIKISKTTEEKKESYYILPMFQNM